MEQLFYDFNSEVQFASDEEWHKRKGEDKATVHHFTGPDPGLIRVVAPDISGDSSSFDFFRPMFTEELFSTILRETNRYYQKHAQKQENRIL
jgi:hypothetical protein